MDAPESLCRLSFGAGPIDPLFRDQLDAEAPGGGLSSSDPRQGCELLTSSALYRYFLSSDHRLINPMYVQYLYESIRLLTNKTPPRHKTDSRMIQALTRPVNSEIINDVAAITHDLYGLMKKADES